MDLTGAANSDAGVTINLRNMNSTVLSPDQTVAAVGSGSRWIDVYRALDPLSLTVPGGRNGDVGVGGYTLGGGISYFGPRVGWGCDNVVNFEVRPSLKISSSSTILVLRYPPTDRVKLMGENESRSSYRPGTWSTPIEAPTRISGSH